MAELGSRAELEKVIADLRRARDEQGGQIAQLGRAVEDLGNALNATTQEAAELRLAAQRAALPAADALALDEFVVRGQDGQIARGWSYRGQGGQAIQTPPIRLFNEQTEEDSLPGLLDSEAPDRWADELKRLVSQRALIRACTKNSLRGPHSPKTDRKILRHLRACPNPDLRRIFTDSSGLGAEWIPDTHSATLYEYARAARRVAALFQELPMGDKNLILPFLAVGMRPYLKGQPTNDNPGQYVASSISTESRSPTAVSRAVRALLSEDANEDSVIAALPLLEREVAAALVDGEEDCIINGDTTATHQDTIASWNVRSRWGSSGLGGSDDHRRGWIGLRKRASAVSAASDGSAVKTYAGALTLRGSLDSPMGLGADCVFLTSPEYYLKTILGWDQVATVDKYGPNATILSGEVARIGNAPLIISEFVSSDMNNSGVFDNTTTDKTGMLAFNRTRFLIGRRRSIMVESEKDITRGVWNVVATDREAFFTIDATGKKNVAYHYKL